MVGGTKKIRSRFQCIYHCTYCDVIKLVNRNCCIRHNPSLSTCFYLLKSWRLLANVWNISVSLRLCTVCFPLVFRDKLVTLAKVEVPQSDDRNSKYMHRACHCSPYRQVISNALISRLKLLKRLDLVVYEYTCGKPNSHPHLHLSYVSPALGYETWHSTRNNPITDTSEVGTSICL